MGWLRLGLLRDHGRARPPGAGGDHLRCCGRPLALSADPAKPPEEPYVAHFLVPAARWWEDVVWTCSNIRLACDAGHAREPGAVVDLPTMWRLGSVWYGGRLRDDFRRRTPEEANAIFADLGLTGPFWTLAS